MEAARRRERPRRAREDTAGAGSAKAGRRSAWRRRRRRGAPGSGLLGSASCGHRVPGFAEVRGAVRQGAGWDWPASPPPVSHSHSCENPEFKLGAPR